MPTVAPGMLSWIGGKWWHHVCSHELVANSGTRYALMNWWKWVTLNTDGDRNESTNMNAISVRTAHLVAVRNDAYSSTDIRPNGWSLDYLAGRSDLAGYSWLYMDTRGCSLQRLLVIFITTVVIDIHCSIFMDIHCNRTHGYSLQPCPYFIVIILMNSHCNRISGYSLHHIQGYLLQPYS